MFQRSKTKTKLIRNILYRSNIKIITLLLLSVVFFSSPSKAQKPLLDSLTLDTLSAYTSLEEALKKPSKVVKLILKRKKYELFPEDIFKFHNLQYLDLSKNRIENIPAKIGDLKQLQYFSISKNELKEFPYQIGNLSNLYYLDGSRNNIYSLPISIGKLKKLKNLDLWDNYIDFLPDEIKTCPKLKILDMRNILISQTKQDAMNSLLKHTKIYFSPACQCEQ